MQPTSSRAVAWRVDDRTAAAADFDGLIAVLDPGVVVYIDEAAGHPGAPREIRRPDNWARGALAFSPMAGFLQAMRVDGTVGLGVGTPRHLARVLRMTITHGKIVEVDVIAGRARLRNLDLAVLENYARNLRSTDVL